MKKGLFRIDGPFYTLINKIVDLGFVTLLWLVGCLPVVTIFTSTASMYHTVVKCIRYDRGSVFSTFKESYINNLRQGIVLMAFYSLVGSAIMSADYYVFFVSADRSALSYILSVILLLVTAVYILNLVWVAPALSRFENTFGNALKLVYVLALRNLVRGFFLLLLILAGVVIFLVWNGVFIIMPGLLSLCYSLVSEPALRKFMPVQEEDNGDWRYGFR